MFKCCADCAEKNPRKKLSKLLKTWHVTVENVWLCDEIERTDSCFLRTRKNGRISYRKMRRTSVEQWYFKHFIKLKHSQIWNGQKSAVFLHFLHIVAGHLSGPVDMHSSRHQCRNKNHHFEWKENRNSPLKHAMHWSSESLSFYQNLVLFVVVLWWNIFSKVSRGKKISPRRGVFTRFFTTSFFGLIWEENETSRMLQESASIMH